MVELGFFKSSRVGVGVSRGRGIYRDFDDSVIIRSPLKCYSINEINSGPEHLEVVKASGCKLEGWSSLESHHICIPPPYLDFRGYSNVEMDANREVPRKSRSNKRGQRKRCHFDTMLKWRFVDK